ncbi:MAG: HAD hydrolase family protein [Candidatus Sumerlaeaceae bacterium]|nr:HAD hydrolase family protein [Candidatus Sumerlaeaceae bacterium]
MLKLEKPVRLFVADIDGCLSGGSTTQYSVEMIEKLQHANRASRTDPAVPAVTFCTGRPQPYVECLIQATHGYKSALCEGGALFFDPVNHLVHTHPSFGPREQKLLSELRAMVARELVNDQVMFEPGKVTHITLILAPPLRPPDLIGKAEEIAGRFGETFMVEQTRVCVHILFRHLHKGTGIEWLSEHTGIGPSEMAGIGDAGPDIPFLKMMGVACAPANAHADVKAVADFVSERPDAQAAAEFLDHIIAANRALGVSAAR